jgi:hypothetical protein
LYEWDRRLTHHRVEQITHLIETGKALDDVQNQAPYTHEYLPLAVRRGPERLLFLGAETLQPGDEVVSLTFDG